MREFRREPLSPGVLRAAQLFGSRLEGAFERRRGALGGDVDPHQMFFGEIDKRSRAAGRGLYIFHQ